MKMKMKMIEEDLFVGIDLHSNNHVVGMQTITNKRVGSRRLPNRMEVLKNFLTPYKDRIRGIAVESTYNWYWLVDGLMDEGYCVHLAHPPAIKQYTGLKHTDDKHDAFFLAHLLQLGILPTGYIYPKEQRPLRDLNRKCRRFIEQRTTQIQSLNSFLSRNYGTRLTAYRIKTMKNDDDLVSLVKDDNLLAAALAHINTIRHLSHSIKQLEAKVLSQVKLLPPYERLLAIPGIGKAFAVTIMMETGNINRFPDGGEYVSYCRLVKSNKTSNNKSKGKNNRKNGNQYLSWVYAGVAQKAKGCCPLAKAFFEKKAKRTNVPVAYNALAHKIAKACYYMIKKNEDYDVQRVFGNPKK